MARTDNLKNYLTDVANAIREKTNTTDKIKASEFDTKIRGISGGSEQWEWALNNVINFGSTNPTFFKGNKYLKVMPNYFNEECAKITNWSNAFNGCSNLVDVDIDTSAGTNFASTFRACTKLTNESIKNLNFNKMTNGFAMFGYGTKITQLPKFNHDTITDMGEMFWDSSLSDLGETDLNFPNVTNANRVFGQTQITKVPNLSFPEATNAKGLFLYCSKLNNFPQNLFLPKATSIYELLKGCTSLTKVGNIDASSATNCAFAFNGCTNLEVIGNLIFNKCTTVQGTFYDCSKLKTIEIFSIPKVQTFNNPFYACTALESIKQLKINSATNLDTLFTHSNNLKFIDFVNSTSKVNKFSGLFSGKTVLETVKGLDLSSATNVSNMFLGCSNLKNVTFAENSIKISFNLGDSPLLTDESIQSLINGLATVTSQQTLTLHTDVKSKLTDGQNDTITSKNWKLA